MGVRMCKCNKCADMQMRRYANVQNRRLSPFVIQSEGSYKSDRKAHKVLRFAQDEKTPI